MRTALLVMVLLLSITTVLATPPLSKQQLDDIRSYVASNNVPVDYIVPVIDAAAEEINQYIGSATPYNIFNKFSFAQQNQIILGVQKYAYPPPPIPQAQPDPVFNVLDNEQQTEDQNKINLIQQFYPKLTQQDYSNLYIKWQAYKYSSQVCQ